MTFGGLTVRDSCLPLALFTWLAAPSADFRGVGLGKSALWFLQLFTFMGWEIEKESQGEKEKRKAKETEK